jgi:hypothetical protein
METVVVFGITGHHHHEWREEGVWKGKAGREGGRHVEGGGVGKMEPL